MGQLLSTRDAVEDEQTKEIIRIEVKDYVCYRKPVVISQHVEEVKEERSIEVEDYVSYRKPVVFFQHVEEVKEERSIEVKDYVSYRKPVVFSQHVEEVKEERSTEVKDYVSYRKPVVFSQHVEVVKEERWIKHYSSSYKMLLVGEGDFSFSARLAMAFGSASNMVATSLDSLGFLRKNYKRALVNICELKSRGCTVIFGVDATKMAKHSTLNSMIFDRVIFNFPLAGFFSDESRDAQICRHQTLVRLFLANAKSMISEDGEIHIVHKSYGFFREWNLEILASLVGLRLIEEKWFDFTKYPGYRTKCGFGGDRNFNCYLSKTYKFGHNTMHVMG